MDDADEVSKLDAEFLKIIGVEIGLVGHRANPCAVYSVTTRTWLRLMRQAYDLGVADTKKAARHHDFGAAIILLKQGRKMAREGWNGKGMWLILIHNHALVRVINEYENLPWIGMKTADQKFVPWLASQSDMLATDWVEVDR